MLIKEMILFSVLIKMSSQNFLRRENINNELKLWITKEEFRIIIEASFESSHCCNIFINSLNNQIEKFFNMFIHIYWSSYNINYMSYNCHSNIILGSEEKDILQSLSKIPTKIATTQILMVLDDNLDDVSQLFNATYYLNAHANLVSISGIWKLSANYLENREFIKIHDLMDIIPKAINPNFEGRKLKLSAYFKPPHNYLNKTINTTVDGIETEIFLADSEEEQDGIEIKIIMILATKLNFTWTVKKPIGSYKYGRKVNGSIWVGGMIEEVVKEKVDMAFSGIWLTEDTYSIVNLTDPWHEISINFLVPRPKPYTSFWALTRPFSLLVWISVASMLLLYSTYLYCRAWVNPKMPKRYRHFLITVTELGGRLTGIWCPRNTGSLRLQLHLWQTAGLLVVTAYSSSLAARLTNTEYEDRIDTAQQFIEANLTWGRQGTEPNYISIFDLEDPWASQIPSKFRLELDNEDRHNKILEGNYAVMGRLVETFFFPEDFVSGEDLKGYRVMENPVGKFYVSFAVKPWLLKPMNRVINQLRETGILSYIIKDVLRRRAGNYLREVRKEYDILFNNDCARVLTLTPLGAGFALLFGGIFISCIIFYFELKSIKH